MQYRLDKIDNERKTNVKRDIKISLYFKRLKKKSNSKEKNGWENIRNAFSKRKTILRKKFNQYYIKLHTYVIWNEEKI